MNFRFGAFSTVPSKFADGRKWHIFAGFLGAKMSLVSGVFQMFSMKESVVGGTSDVLGLGSKRGKMTEAVWKRGLGIIFDSVIRA